MVRHVVLPDMSMKWTSFQWLLCLNVSSVCYTQPEHFDSVLCFYAKTVKEIVSGQLEQRTLTVLTIAVSILSDRGVRIRAVL